MKVDLITSNSTDQTIVLAVDGVRYEYRFQENFPQVMAVLTGLLRHGVPNRALNWVKQRAVETRKLEERE